MRVKNDFPDVDRVLSKLRQYVAFFEDKKGKEVDEEDANFYLEQVDDFISAIENYLDSVCNDEDRIMRFREQHDSPEDIVEYVQDLDNKRTRYHSNIISNMIMIDKVSKMHGLFKVFDYAEEFEDSFVPLTPKTIEQKRQMTERQRIKRREMGNFGLYIAASVTVGLDMPDKEMRDFASAETEVVDLAKSQEIRQAYDVVKAKLKKSSVTKVTKNMNDMIR